MLAQGRLGGRHARHHFATGGQHGFGQIVRAGLIDVPGGVGPSEVQVVAALLEKKILNSLGDPYEGRERIANLPATERGENDPDREQTHRQLQRL